MKKKMLFIFIALFLLIFMVACNKDKTTEEAEKEETDNTEETTEDDVPSLDESQAKQTIKNFREVVMNVFDNTKDDGEVIDYQSKQEVKEALKKHMSEQLAESYAENYFEEENDKLYVIPMDAPFWIDEEKEFTFEQIDDTTYEVKQELENELAGHIRLTYVITLQDENWIVDEYKTEEIKADDSSQGSETDDTENNNESDKESSEEDQTADKDEQPTEEESEGSPTEDSNGEITKEKAEKLVSKHLNLGENSNFHVVMDHLDDNGNYVVQVYEVVSDGDVSHTATMGWYIVDKKDGSIEEMM